MGSIEAPRRCSLLSNALEVELRELCAEMHVSAGCCISDCAIHVIEILERVDVFEHG